MFFSHPELLPPQRITTMTTMDIQWPQLDLPTSPGTRTSTYDFLWESLFVMNSLRSLRLNLTVGPYNPLPPTATEEMRQRVEIAWLGPPMSLHGALAHG
jgi:hypothetical protein